MSTPATPARGPDLRVAALRRFAIGITVLTVLGHLWLGFESAYAYVVVALLTAYAMEFILEATDARATGRAARYHGGALAVVDFLLPAHITGLACALLLYPGERLWPIAFAVAVATASKTVFRVPLGAGTRHFFNPSNAGITVTLLLFPSVGIAPPYHFTENLSGIGNLVLPGLLLLIGTFLNWRFTGKLPLIAAWLAGFMLQALTRHWLLGAPLGPALGPMTGVAFLLFTLYMVTDPGTTPVRPRAQIAFGASVAAVYGVLMASHVVFGLFFALSLVCAVRGGFIYLHARGWLPQPARLRVAALDKQVSS